MKLYFKNILYFLIVALGGLSLFSCNKSVSPKEFSKNNQIILLPSIEDVPIKKATEEEIKYFITAGRYEINIEDLSSYEDRYDNYIDPDEIKTMGIVDTKGNLVNREDIFDTVKTEDGLMFKRKINIEGYKAIKENYYGADSKSYCAKTHSKLMLENLIFDDSLFAKLYDKNNKIISENIIRNSYVFPIEKYLKDPSSVQHKIKPEGWTDTVLRGVLKLPPKGQREGLKYRIIRLDANGKPKSFLWRLGKPYNLHAWEEPIEPFSEYKNWDYFENEYNSCYVKSYLPSSESDQIGGLRN